MTVQDVENIQPYVTLVKDVVMGIAAIVAFVIAILGYGAWKDQLKGRTEYDVARSLLRSTLKVRDAIAHVRTHYMPSGEISHALKEAGVEIAQDDPHYSFYLNAAVYQQRFNVLREANSQFHADLVEAEAIWGNEVREVVKPLGQATNELYWTIDTMLAERHAGEWPPQDREERLQQVKVLHRIGKDNPFSARVDDAVNGIEDYLKQYLTL